MQRCYCGNGSLIEYSEDYFLCDRCKSLVSKYEFKDDIYEIKEEESDLYGKNYWEKVMVKEANVSDIDELIDLYIHERAAYWLDITLKYVKLGGKIAEVGCGLGQFSYLLNCAGFKETAFELSPEICRSIESKLGVNVHCGELSSLENTYDSIVAMDVLEHLINPIGFLQDCSERLVNNGILVLQTPCFDDSLSYEDMLVKKPKFKHLLVRNQHVYLFSKTSISNMLKQQGFAYIEFEPAFFGDDYDMFVFASREAIKKNADKEINNYLNRIKTGRIIKAMLNMLRLNRKSAQNCLAIEEERKKILCDNEKLTQMVKENQLFAEQYSRAASERATLIERVSRENEKNEKTAKKRLELINQLTANIEVYKQTMQERLEVIERLSAENEKNEKAAEERLELINQLTANIEVCKQTMQERLEVIEKITLENEENARAAEERLELVNHLTTELRVYKKAAEERLELINKLTSSEDKNE